LTPSFLFIFVSTSLLLFSSLRISSLHGRDSSYLLLFIYFIFFDVSTLDDNDDGMRGQPPVFNRRIFFFFIFLDLLFVYLLCPIVLYLRCDM